MLNIGIILGSVRENSLGEWILKYLETQNPNTEKVTYHWLKLRDYPLPAYDHEETPLSQPIQNLSEAEAHWLNDLKKMDGYIFLSPEYDHAMSGALKNALDYVGPEVYRKPAMIVTYSYYSDGGMLAAQSFAPVLQMLKMMVLPTPVLLWNATDNFDAQGNLLAHENSSHFAKRLAEAIAEIDFYAKIFKDNPYQLHLDDE